MIVCLVIAVHACAVALLLAQRKIASPLDESAMVWLRIDAPIPQPEVSTPPGEALREVQSSIRLPEPSITTAPGSSDESEPQINWQDQGAFYARRAIEEAAAERHRHLGPRKDAPPNASGPSALFESERSVHGETGEDAMRNPIVRYNENCYSELSKTVQTAEDLAGMAAMRKSERPLFKCAFKAGSREARGDLFDHIKRTPAVAAVPQDEKKQ